MNEEKQYWYIMRGKKEFKDKLSYVGINTEKHALMILKIHSKIGKFLQKEAMIIKKQLGEK